MNGHGDGRAPSPLSQPPSPFSRLSLSLSHLSPLFSDVASLQRPDGSFAGDAWGEVDTRFSYCALATAALLGRLEELDVPAAVAFLAACRNFDGGFGATPGGESHAGQAFTCVAALAIASTVHPPAAAVVSWRHNSTRPPRWRTSLAFKASSFGT